MLIQLYKTKQIKMLDNCKLLLHKLASIRVTTSGTSPISHCDITPVTTPGKQCDTVFQVITGYKSDTGRQVVVWFFIFITLGFLRLIFFWRPDWMLKCTHVTCPLSQATSLLAKVSHPLSHWLGLSNINFHYSVSCYNKVSSFST